MIIRMIQNDTSFVQQTICKCVWLEIPSGWKNCEGEESAAVTRGANECMALRDLSEPLVVSSNFG